MAVVGPECRERSRHAQVELGVPGRLENVQSRAIVVELALLPIQPFPPAAQLLVPQPRFRLLGDRQEILRVAASQLHSLVRCGEPLGRVLANRLEHPEPFLGAPNEALVDEGLERVEVGVDDLFGRFQR